MQAKVQPHPGNVNKTVAPSAPGAAMEVDRVRTPSSSPAGSFSNSTSGAVVAGGERESDAMVITKKRRLDGSAESSPEDEYADADSDTESARKRGGQGEAGEEEDEATQMDVQAPGSSLSNSGKHDGKISRENSQGSTDMEIEAAKPSSQKSSPASAPVSSSSSSSPVPASSSSSSSSSASSSASPAADDPRPVCKYGVNCYRKNPQHFQQFSHPHLAKK